MHNLYNIRMKNIRLKIYDETLRDGEQQVGVFFQEETKRHLAHLINQTGVAQIAIMPGIHKTEERLVKTLVAEGLGSKVAASTMMDKEFIDQSQACGVEQIILFYAVSDRLLFLRDTEVFHNPSFRGKTVDDDIPKAVIHKVRQNMIDKVLKNLRYAKEIGLKVCFAAEDASRADFDFLVECICTFRPYLEHFLLCDTVGVLSPEKTFVWIQELLLHTEYSPLVVHFHNDLGMALENTIQAV